MNPSRLRVLVADDELTARKRLVRLLEELPDVEVLGTCDDAKGVLARVRQGGVDVLLLDVQMPGLSGLDAAAMLPADGPYIIFCTAHPEHAVQAFDAGALDYVLKPIDAARLQKALGRARDRRMPPPSQAQPERRSAEGVHRIAVSTRHGIVLVGPEEITHATLEDELVTLFTSNGKYLTDFTLQELQDKLEPFGFERVHRRALLHLGRVVKLVPLETGGFVAQVRSGETVELSRQAARGIRKRLGLRKTSEEGEDD